MKKVIGPEPGDITLWGAIKSDLNSNFNEIFAALDDLEAANPGGGASPKLATPVVQINGLSQTEFNSFWAAVPNAQKYLVYRGPSASLSGATLLGEKLANDPDWQHSSLTADTNYYTFVIAIADGYLNSDPGSVLAHTDAIPVALFDFYVSATGNDANDGNPANEAIASSTKLEQLLTSFGNGAKVKFEGQKTYYEELIIPQSGVEIDFNFNTFDGSVELPKNAGIYTRPNAGGEPNVWKLTNYPVEEYRESIYFARDGKMAHVVESVAMVNTTPEGVHVPNGFDNQFYQGNPPIPDPRIDVYFYSADDPNTNGISYRIAKRRYAAKFGNGAIVKKLITGGSSDNDGSAVFGDNVQVSQSIFRAGGKHNMFIGSGKVTDCWVWDASHKITAGPFIAYKDNPAGHSLHWQRVYIAMPFARNEPISGIFAHGQGANDKYASAIIEECMAFGDADDIGGLNPVTPMTWRRNYSNGQGLDTLFAGVVYENNFWIPTATNRSMAVGRNVTIRNSAFLLIPNRSVIFQFNGSNGITLDRVTFAGVPTFFGDFSQQTPEPLTFNCSHVCFGAKYSNAINLKNGDVYIGNYNIFVGNGNTFDQFRNSKEGFVGGDGSEIRTLKEWQEQTGQDAQSVWVKAANQATLFLNDPTTGDLRLNPNAVVTGVVNGVNTDFVGTFPDGTPITQCGQQDHWNYNTRSLVAGPQTKLVTNKPLDWDDVLACAASPETWDFYAV